jgi:hypothetical protein
MTKQADLTASERVQFEKMKEIIPEATIDHVHTMPNGMKIMSTPIKQDWEMISCQVGKLGDDMS